MTQEEESSQDEEDEEESKKESDEQSSARPERARNHPNRFGEWVTRCTEDEWANLVTQEPTTYAQAIETTESELWKRAMESEMESLRVNEVWRLTDLPVGRDDLAPDL